MYLDMGIGETMRVLFLLSILLSFTVLSLTASRTQVRYECCSCASLKADTASKPNPEIERLEGDEKEDAVSRAISSEDFKLVNSI